MTQVPDSEPSRTQSRRQEIEALYTRYGALVEGRCRYLLRDPESARDATQEVFVKLMKSLDGFRGEASPSTWILRIATNHCLNVIAANRAGWRERFRRYVEHAREGAEVPGAHPERAQLVQEVLGRLDAETQAVAIHYFVDEMTQEEIAEAIGRSLPTIRKRLEKFRRVAKKELGREPE